MGITVEKIEGKEGMMKLLDMLSGGGASEHMAKLREAKKKMESVGFSNDAMAALADFTFNVEELAKVTAVASVIAKFTKDHAAAEFALAGMKWMEIGLDNSHSMLEKAGISPDVFGIRPRSDGYNEVLRRKMRELRAETKEYFVYTVTDMHDNTTKLSSVTEGEAAIEALANMGYTLTFTRK